MHKHSYPQGAPLLYASALETTHMWALWLCAIWKVEEWEGLPCDTRHLCHSRVIYDIITNTHKKCTYNKRSGHCFVCMSAAWFSQKPGMGCVTPSHYPMIPTGSLGTRSSSSLFSLPGDWQGVTLWWGGKSGREAIDLRPIVETAQQSHTLPWPRKQAG